MRTAAEPHRFPFQAMGSPCEVQLFARRRDLAEDVARAVIADVQRLEARYSRYREGSLLSEINRVAAAGGRIRVDAETATLLDYASTCFVESGGLFDVTSGLLRRAWRFREGRLPTQAELDPLLDRIGWHRVAWLAPVLVFDVPGMELDLGGMVKEYAADLGASLCRQAGLSGLINLGGDIAIAGPRPDGLPWQIGLRDPRRPGAVLQVLSLQRGAVATSGDSERCLVVDGVRYGHVLDPRTGWPVGWLASVTAVGEHCVAAGAATTIAMLKEREGPAWLEELGLPHLWMDADGRIGGTLAGGR
jgi:thiamine biosynthesis lipoprotein